MVEIKNMYVKIFEIKLFIKMSKFEIVGKQTLSILSADYQKVLIWFLQDLPITKK